MFLWFLGLDLWRDSLYTPENQSTNIMNLSLKPMASIRAFTFVTLLILGVGVASAQVSSGSGTAGKIPVWAGPHSQGNSMIIQSSSKVGIGTTAPTGLLSVTNTTATPAIIANESGTGPAIWGIGSSGYGVRGNSNTGVGLAGYSGTFVGLIGNGPSIGVWGAGTGVGVYGHSTGSGDGVSGAGTDGYAGNFSSTNYRGVLISNPLNGLNNLRVDGQSDNGHTAVDILGGNLRVENDLIVVGSKSGYVVDIMKNADGVPLETGDVVVVAGDSAAPVLGQIPTPSIKLASAANDSAVVGVVDKAVYVPDPATRAAYDAQEQADRAAAAAAQAHIGDGSGVSAVANINNRISDDAGTIHRSVASARVAAGGYCNVVTLGSFKAVKVDASFGAIKAGDLLTTSPQPGYAMKVTDKTAASGAIIGKALSSLESGTGTVSVLVSLK